jgi:hypothetical protein
MKLREGVDVLINVFLTSALAGGVLLSSTSQSFLLSKKESPVPIRWEAGCDPGPDWTR